MFQSYFYVNFCWPRVLSFRFFKCALRSKVLFCNLWTQSKLYKKLIRFSFHVDVVYIREHHCLQLFHYIYRHVQVAAMMKREKVHIKHRFDPWHLAKSVRKDLVAASNKRECTELASWTASVVNHLWCCAATSHGDQLFCQQKWKSIIYHVAGIHEWPDFQLFSACGHDELTNQQRRNKLWLPIGSPSHNTLKEVAWKPKLLGPVVRKPINLIQD